MTKQFFFSLFAIAVFPCVVQAGDSAYRQNVNTLSRTGVVASQGKAVQSLRVLEVLESAESNETVTDKLLDRLGKSARPGDARRQGIVTQGIEKMVSLADSFRVGNSDWSLSVRGNGTQVQYQNYAFVDANPDLKQLGKLSESKLEVLSRKFIDQELTDFLPREQNEDFVLWATQFEHETGGSADGKEHYDQVVANRAIFSRTVDGVSVVGNGSKIVVTLANDGSVVGFAYDWPAYEDGGIDQDLVDGSTALDRAAALVSPTPSTLTASHHECGYFDPGYTYRSPYAPVQAGCFTHLERARAQTGEAKGEVIHSGITFATPLGKIVEYDAELEQSHPALVGKVGLDEIPDFGPVNAKARAALMQIQ